MPATEFEPPFSGAVDTERPRSAHSIEDLPSTFQQFRQCPFSPSGEKVADRPDNGHPRCPVFSSVGNDRRPLPYTRRSADGHGIKSSNGCQSPDDSRCFTKNQGTYVPRSPNEFLNSTPLVAPSTGIDLSLAADGNPLLLAAQPGNFIRVTSRPFAVPKLFWSEPRIDANICTGVFPAQWANH